MSRTRKAKPAAGDEATTPGIINGNDMVEVQSVAVREAKAGNVQAAEIVERMWRRGRGPLVKLDLPLVTDAASLAAAQAEVIAAAARRDITPREGLAFAGMLECRRRALGLVEYEARMTAIEKANEERAKRERERGAEGWR